MESSMLCPCFVDGRDVAPQCAQGYLKDLGETYMAGSKLWQNCYS